MITRNQRNKQFYLNIFYTLIETEMKSPEYADLGLMIEPSVGSVLYVQDGDFMYCNIGIPQYLGGEEFPENDDVRFCLVRETGLDDDSEILVDLPFVLTYVFEDDLPRYFDLVRQCKESFFALSA